LIEFIVPDILLFLKDYSSTPPENLRELIRKDLVSTANLEYSNLMDSFSNWSDLHQIPNSNKLGVSISHTQMYGGFILSSKYLKIGLDLEFVDRIRPEIVQRVSTKNEVLMAPDAYRLWTAKEASFKAHYPKNPEVLSKIQIENWQQLDSGIYTFEFMSPELTSHNLKGNGWNFNKKRLNLSICSISY